MAIVRFGDDSDVYVYYGAEGYVCCGCRLMRRGEFSSHNEEAMIAHLQRHQAVGHQVPEDAFVTLRNIAERNRRSAARSKRQMILSLFMVFIGLVAYVFHFATADDPWPAVSDVGDVLAVIVIASPWIFLVGYMGSILWSRRHG